MSLWRAAGLLEQHILWNKPDRQAQLDWLEEMDMPFEVNRKSPMLRDLVTTGAAVDYVDAHDIMTTELLAEKQPHRASELRKGLTERRTRRMRVARGL